MLGGGLSRPWAWAIEFIVFGDDGLRGVSISSHHAKGSARWKRPILVAYWVGTIIVAVGGWQTRLVRARRIHLQNNGNSPDIITDTPSVKVPSDRVKIGVEGAREEKRIHASLNMRRKFFHALAVMMFAPGIIVDVSFDLSYLAACSSYYLLMGHMNSFKIAVFHISRFFSCLCTIYFLGIRSIFCFISYWCSTSHLFLRVR